VEEVKVQSVVKVKKDRREGTKVLTAVTKKNSILWIMMPCTVVKSLLSASC
jgi:hypothetical protein